MRLRELRREAQRTSPQNCAAEFAQQNCAELRARGAAHRPWIAFSATMMTDPSSRHWRSAPGRWTLTAIGRPSCVSPLYTWPSDAEAMHVALSDLKRAGPSGS